ncbi:MAG TPA: hypothetical protein PKO10_00720 [Aliarcobacter cryaerophilus]|jgi:hypothetical protein|nr:hypothetical protein [Aliarcobacter cryaerophilus]
MEVHQAEFELLKRIRERYQYGEITIVIKDGLPTDIVREYHKDKIWFG